MYEAACAILLRPDGCILLGLRAAHRRSYPNTWDVIGGRIEEGETAEQALIRELAEEIGVVPLEFRHLGVIDDRGPQARGSGRYHMFVVTRWHGEPVMRNDEHTALEWHTTAEACAQPDLALAAYRPMFASLRVSAPIEWRLSDGPVGYAHAVAEMEARAADIADGRARELVWLLEHPPLYTAGTSARPKDLVAPNRFPVFEAGRGGQYTYHGPGQRVAYVMLDVRRRGGDVRRFVGKLEAWVIATLDAFNVRGETRSGRVGVWVARPDKGHGREDKIAAIGIRVRHGVSFHGVSVNVEPDLEHFSGIVPCGIADQGVTSLVDLGLPVGMADVDVALRRAFETVFDAETQLV